MKILYFDIDGTLLSDFELKPALADGRFEIAVREAGFQQLVCVSNLVKIIIALDEMGEPTDGLGMIFSLCRGAFAEEAWFRKVTKLVPQPQHRARFIDLNADWYYLDDLADDFISGDGLSRPLQSIHRKTYSGAAAAE